MQVHNDRDAGRDRQKEKGIHDLEERDEERKGLRKKERRRGKLMQWHVNCPFKMYGKIIVQLKSHGGK